MSWLVKVLDYIPVIGTVKNTVEAVSDIYHGDYHRAAQKGGEAVLGLALDLTSFGAGRLVETAAVQAAKEIAVKKIGKEAAKKVVTTTVGWGTGLVVSFAARHMRKQIQTHTDEGEATQRRSRRGEHVININVMKVFRTIIDRFGYKIGKSAVHFLRTGTRAYQAYHSPLSSYTTNAIQSIMLAHIPYDEPYIDANGAVYGRAIEEISNLAVEYLCKCYYRSMRHSTDVLRNIREKVISLNERQLYVDEYSKQYWLRRGGDMAMYDRCQQDVARMFTNMTSNYEIQQWLSEMDFTSD